MSPFNGIFRIVLVAVVVLTATPRWLQAQPQRVGPVQVELVSKTQSIQPGQPFEVGLRISPDEEWHVYWKNPGDAGLPPTMQWTLPAGFKASEIHYPAPSLILSGPLAAYGYHGEILYPVTITPLENLSPGDQATIALKADWLVCRVECLPGSAELSLTLPVATGQPKLNESVRALFEKVERLRPQDLPNNWETQATVNESTIYLDLRPGHILETPVKLHFFADEKAIIEHAAEQPFDEIDGLYRVRLTRSPYSTEKPDSLTGTLAVTNDGSTDYFDLSIPFGANPAGVVSATAGESGINVGLALLFAFIGGLILNLMPCVLPVLSIKVLGLIGQANESRRSAVNHGLFFTLGVVATFWAIVATMLLLQAGGQQLGWGFQLQSPTFVMILATFMFLFALSLFGVFEISLFSGVGANGGRSKSGGMAGAFMSGITATLVATPCTAPFMGAALGYTLTQPAAVSLLVYTVLGLGMAFPYLLLSIFPNLLKFVPKPGRWMETFKQAMGFLLAATVIWLAWLLSSLAGVTALIALLGVLLFVAIAAWIYGRWGTVVSTSPVRWSSRIIAVLLVCVSLVAGNTGISTLATAPQRSAEAPSNGIAWKEYSDSYLEELLAQGRSVFIDFTAAWCLSCKVNERVAFSSEEVQGRFSELGIVPLVADWTHRSDEITEALARFGRNSVPLYVLYPAGDKADPILLPEILTPGIVLDALNKIDNLQPSQSIQTTERNQL